ncbi:MAG: molybdate ABC transporter substrate-binding protein [Nitrospirae bacterium]|nr:molybdate ABC transporter substrate-binding protein [Nitrospirota bacterium]
MKYIGMFAVIALLSLLPVTIDAAAEMELTVSAAISLKDAFEEIRKLFQAGHKGVKVLYNFGASGSLARQIEEGAPADVFASAAQKDMDDIEIKGLVVPGTRLNFARNSVVLVVPTSGDVRIDSFAALKLAGIKKVAIGNPRTVPAGRYAKEVLDFYKTLPAVNNKLILAENARQVLDYVATGEVDAGVVYMTEALTRTKEVKVVSTAPEQSHKPVIYPIAVVRGTKNEKLSVAFIQTVNSQTAQGILKKYGFTTQK